MPCNAYNHDNARCNCGWGGVFYGSDSRGYTSNNIGSGFEIWASTGTTVRSFTDPNARCPECGSAVFFYRSPHDGRVFFDSLGPPWPKHVCTDRARHQNKTPQWQRNGWIPVTRSSPISSRRTVLGYDATSSATIKIEDEIFDLEWMMLLPFNWDGPVLLKPSEEAGKWILESVEIRSAKRSGGKPYIKRHRLTATKR